MGVEKLSREQLLAEIEKRDERITCLEGRLRLGRATAAAILHGRKPWSAPATFLPGKTTRRTAST